MSKEVPALMNTIPLRRVDIMKLANRASMTCTWSPCSRYSCLLRKLPQYGPIALSPTVTLQCQPLPISIRPEVRWYLLRVPSLLPLTSHRPVSEQPLAASSTCVGRVGRHTSSSPPPSSPDDGRDFSTECRTRATGIKSEAPVCCLLVVVHGGQPSPADQASPVQDCRWRWCGVQNVQRGAR